MNFQDQSYIQCEEQKKKLLAGDRICTKVDASCVGQCPHKDPHQHESDCDNHQCSRDNHVRIVYCEVVK